LPPTATGRRSPAVSRSTRGRLVSIPTVTGCSKTSNPALQRVMGGLSRGVGLPPAVRCNRRRFRRGFNSYRFSGRYHSRCTRSTRPAGSSSSARRALEETTPPGSLQG
jgi:hypothetical protein